MFWGTWILIGIVGSVLLFFVGVLIGAGTTRSHSVISTSFILAVCFLGFTLVRACNSYRFPYTAKKIVIMGKIINRETGEWPNDRLVLTYLKEEEIGRAISAIGEFSENDQGIQDGLFTIPISNTYRLSPSDFLAAANLTSGHYPEGIYIWFELEEGHKVEIRVPSKNLTYIVKSVAGDKSTLPPRLLEAGLTRLTKTNEIIVSLANAPEGEAQNISIKGIPAIENVQYNSEQETIILNKITVPLNNCAGSSIFAQDFIQTQTFIHEYKVEIGGEVGVEMPLPIQIVWPKLIATLQANYGFEQGQIDTRTVAYHMEAQPATSQAYVITWKEVWVSGKAQTVVQDDKISVPFRVRTDLIYEVESQKLICN